MHAGDDDAHDASGGRTDPRGADRPQRSGARFGFFAPWNVRASEVKAPPEVVVGRGAPWLGAALALIAALLGLQGTAFWLFRARGPSPVEHREAGRALRAAYRPGDLIFLLPPYATEAREYLGDLEVRAVRSPLDEDLEVYDRVWLYGLFGEERGTSRALERVGHDLEHREEHGGGIALERFALRGLRAAVRWRAIDAIKEARVEHEHSDRRREACDRFRSESHRGGPGGRWVCPHDGDWLYVGPEWHRMGERPRRCLWAHPPREGRLVVRFLNVPLTGTLAGWAGHTLNASTRANAAVQLDVRVGEGTEQSFVFELEDTWRPFRMRTLTTGTATVSFAVSSADNGANHFCFVADTRQMRRDEGEAR